MIRVVRGEEPAALRDARWWRLACARERRKIGLLPDGVFVGYDDARAPLHEAQRKTCAFCEANVVLAGAAVEHFRPKQRAQRIDWTGLVAHASDDERQRFKEGMPPSDRELVRWISDAEGYWWLTWCWDNLFVACTACNTAYKRGHFPLRRDAKAAAFEGRSCADEESLLIDPSRTEPMEHIRFALANGQWRPTARRQSPIGAWTIAVLGLADPDHVDFYTRHVARRRELIEKLRDAKKKAQRTNETSELHAAWSELAAKVFEPGEPYQGLMWDVLDWEVRAPDRDRWGLSHPWPMAFVPEGPPMSEKEVAHLDALDAETRWLVRRAWSREDAEVLREALEAVCVRRPSSREELATMTGRALDTLRDYLSDLVNAGTLARSADGRYGAADASK